MKKNFNVDGVTIETSSTGLTFVNIKTKYCTCAITTNGAHVTEFTPTGEKPVMWMSKSSNLTVNSALRGGVPVCAPWFGPAPVAGRPNHGIVRTQIWEIEEISSLVGGAVKVVMSLDSSNIDKSLYDWSFKATMTIIAANTLEMTLSFTNTDDKEGIFTGALHTYFAVSNIDNVTVKGLSNHTYEDKVPGAVQTSGVLQNGDIKVASEVDRVYQPSFGSTFLCDSGWNRVIRVDKTGSGSTVVWNPWIEKSKKMADFGDLEYKEMICIESAIALNDARKVAPNATVIFSQKLSIEK
jgi:glucose-6-phosphate 1-epimerase